MIIERNMQGRLSLRTITDGSAFEIAVPLTGVEP
jgi:hypothetical protein